MEDMLKTIPTSELLKELENRRQTEAPKKIDQINLLFTQLNAMGFVLEDDENDTCSKIEATIEYDNLVRIRYTYE